MRLKMMNVFFRAHRLTYPTGGGARGSIGGGKLYVGKSWALGGFSNNIPERNNKRKTEGLRTHYNYVYETTKQMEEYYVLQITLGDGSNTTAAVLCCAMPFCSAGCRHDPPHHMLARLTLLSPETASKVFHRKSPYKTALYSECNIIIY